MSRWITAAAVLAAAGTVLICPLEARAQGDTAYVLCGFESDHSWARITNTVPTRPRSMCRWECFYQTKSGGTHVNKGAARISYLAMKETKRGASGITGGLGGSGSCGGE